MKYSDFITWLPQNVGQSKWFLSELLWKVDDETLNRQATLTYNGQKIDLTLPENAAIKTEFLNLPIQWGSPELPIDPEGLIQIQLGTNSGEILSYRYYPSQLATVAHLLGAIFTIFQRPAGLTEIKDKKWNLDRDYQRNLMKRIKRGETIKLLDLFDGNDFGGLIFTTVPGVYYAEIYTAI